MLIYRATNNITEDIYIGKTEKSLKERKRAHVNSKSDCYFHRALRKYGADNFVWDVVEEFEDAKLLGYAECFYIGYVRGISKFTKTKVYNMTDGGEGAKGWRPHSEWREKQRKRMLGNTQCYFWDRLSEDEKNAYRAKMSKATSGLRNGNYGNVGKKSAVSKRYLLTSPTGEIFEVHGLRKFCRDHPEFQLHHPQLSACAVGKRDFYKGWACSYRR